MKQISEEEKQLLLKDLSARLPFDLNIRIIGDWLYDERPPYDSILTPGTYFGFKTDKFLIVPYLRPMSSMTQEECRELRGIMITEPLWGMFDFFYSNHIDFRGLIPKGLALEANEDMYKIKEK